MQRLPLFAESPRARVIRALRDDPSFGLFLVYKNDSWVRWACQMIDDQYCDPARCSLNDFWSLYLDHDEWRERDWEDLDEDEQEEITEWDQVFGHIFEVGAEWASKHLKEKYEKIEDWVWAEEVMSWFDHECGEFLPTTTAVFELPPKHKPLSFCLIDLEPPTFGGVYFIQIGRRVKIGQSKNIASRLSDLATSSPEKPRLIGYEINTVPQRRERELHQQWRNFRKHREWFEIEGALLTFLVEMNHRLAVLAEART